MQSTDKRATNKLVVLKLDGSISQGLRVELEIGPEGQRATATCQGHLPKNPELFLALKQWQSKYRSASQANRISAMGMITKGFINQARNWKQDCLNQAAGLSQAFGQWLKALSFQQVEQRLREELQRDDRIRIVIRTEDSHIPQLPWHLWSFIERYPYSEVVFSNSQIEERPRRDTKPRKRNQVRILVVVGDSLGIDTDSDRQQLSQLQDAEVTVLVEPRQQELTDALWDQQGWDILFFAGHSQTEPQQIEFQQAQQKNDVDQAPQQPFRKLQTEQSQLPSPPPPSGNSKTQGRLFINPEDSLTIKELRYGLRQAISHNLKLAIFNSCDGLGLAQNLAELNFPHLVVMREPVPDHVAQTFLKYFLHHFAAQGTTLNLAIRHAREQLQGLEATYPCASWLPVLYQHSEVVPPTWKQLNQGTSDNDALIPKRQWGQLFAISLGVTAAVIGMQNLGFVRFLELRSFDTLMHLRPQEAANDSRILIIEVTEEDVQSQEPDERRGSSLPDSDLEKLLRILKQDKASQPRAIGLDIYRDFPVPQDKYPKLAEWMSDADQFVAICKHQDSELLEVPPPPEVSALAQGFSDIDLDSDSRVRRHLLSFSPEAGGKCVTEYAFSMQLALRYLQRQGIQLKIDKSTGLWKLGQATFHPLLPGQVPYTSTELEGHQIPLNYRISGNTEQAFDRVSLSEFLDNNLDPDKFIRDRVVIIGTTAHSFSDEVQTPFSGAGQIPGVVLQAQMVSQLIDGALGDRYLLWPWPRWIIYLGLLSSALLSGWVGQSQLWSKSRLPYSGILALLSLGYGGLCWLILALFGGWTPLLPVLATLWGSATLTRRLSQRQTVDPGKPFHLSNIHKDQQ